jgi:hypothetical protein
LFQFLRIEELYSSFQSSFQGKGVLTEGLVSRGARVKSAEGEVKATEACAREDDA